MPDSKTTDILLIRQSQDGCEMPLADIITVPEAIMDKGPHQAANDAYDLMCRICADWAKAHGITRAMNPVDFLDIPNEFKSRYGVKTEPVDTFVTITVDMDEDLTEEPT